MFQKFSILLLLAGSVYSDDISADHEDSSPPMLSNRVKSLVMSSFEAYRRLIRDSGPIQEFLRERLCLPEITRVENLDPLVLSDTIVHEYTDKETPVFGKVVITVDDIKFFGISDFRVESIANSNGSLNFIHRVPKMITTANFTVDYELFNQIPFRISEGTLQTNIVDARINGTFQMYPDAVDSWFRVAQLNVTTACEEPLDIVIEPKFVTTDKFVINSETIGIFSQLIRSVLPKVAEVLKLTYAKAIELKTL